MFSAHQKRNVQYSNYVIFWEVPRFFLVEIKRRVLYVGQSAIGMVGDVEFLSVLTETEIFMSEMWVGSQVFFISRADTNIY